MFYDTFLHHLRQLRLFGPHDRLLVAVSGGLDSVVLLDLLHQAGYEVGVAHINFQLRGDESDADAAWVQQLAAAYGCPFHYTAFDTRAAVAAAAGESVQMVARRLRYAWLETVRAEAGYAYVATAHHAYDQLETQLLRLAQGTGLAGLRGIPPLHGAVVRPLLFAAKEDLQQYATTRGLTYREDSSNLTDLYRRNQLRHHVLPTLLDINPALAATTTANTARLTEAYALYQWAVAAWRNQLLQTHAPGYRVNRQDLANSPAPASLLYEWLREWGFSAEQCRQAAQAEPGLAITAHQPTPDGQTWQLTLQTDWLLWAPLQPTLQEVEVPAVPAHVQLNDGLKLAFHLAPAPTTFPADPAEAWFDLHRLAFPLRLRGWQPGDWFCPLGMDGQRQKLQDFFVNQKIDQLARHRQWLLLDAHGQVVWVVGRRPDDRFKVTPSTQQALRVSSQQSL